MLLARTLRETGLAMSLPPDADGSQTLAASRDECETESDEDQEEDAGPVSSAASAMQSATAAVAAPSLLMPQSASDANSWHSQTVGALGQHQHAAAAAQQTPFQVHLAFYSGVRGFCFFSFIHASVSLHGRLP